MLLVLTLESPIVFRFDVSGTGLGVDLAWTVVRTSVFFRNHKYCLQLGAWRLTVSAHDPHDDHANLIMGCKIDPCRTTVRIYFSMRAPCLTTVDGKKTRPFVLTHEDNVTP